MDSSNDVDNPLRTRRSLTVIPPYLLFILSTNSQNKYISNVGLFHKVGLGSHNTFAVVYPIDDFAVLLDLGQPLPDGQSHRTFHTCVEVNTFLTFINKLP